MSPICSICVAIGLGLGAGYVAGVYDRPLSNDASLRAGLIAGALTGGLMIPGGIIAAVINAGSMQSGGGQALTEIFGLPPQPAEVFWAAQLYRGLLYRADQSGNSGWIWSRRGGHMVPAKPRTGRWGPDPTGPLAE